MNSINLTGRLKGKAEVKESKNGKAYAVINIAVKRPYQDKDGNDLMDTIPVSVFNEDTVNFVKTLRDGDVITVEGQLSAFANKKDDKVYVNLSVNGSRVVLI